MSTLSPKPGGLALACLLLLSTLASSYMLKPGGDTYEIYINNTLVQKHALHQPIANRILSMKNIKASDIIYIHYSHCGETGKNRSISIVDEQGKLLKKWNFTNVGSGHSAMKIAGSELLALRSSAGSMSLVYASAEIPKGQFLTKLA